MRQKTFVPFIKTSIACTCGESKIVKKQIRKLYKVVERSFYIYSVSTCPDLVWKHTNGTGRRTIQRSLWRPLNNVGWRAQRQRVPNIILSIMIFTVSCYEYIIIRLHTIFAYKSRIIYVSIIGRTHIVGMEAIETDKRALITPRQCTIKSPERILDESSKIGKLFSVNQCSQKLSIIKYFCCC